MLLLALATTAVLTAFAVAPPAVGAGGILPVGLDDRAVAEYGGDVEYLTQERGRGSVLVERRRGGGDVLRQLRLERRFHVPTLAYDNSVGGLSADGRRLVLIGYPLPRTRSATTFGLVDVKHMRLERVIRLRGQFSFHALSPDNRQLFLINYAPWSMAEFGVRTYDLVRGLLRPGSVSEPSGVGGAMTGIPMTRATGPGERWQYTLYGVIGEPYLHALDTRTRRAYRTPLTRPRTRARNWWRVRLEADGRRIQVADGNRLIATVDAGTHEAIDPARAKVTSKPAQRTGDRGGVAWLATAAFTGGLLLLAALKLADTHRSRAASP